MAWGHGHQINAFQRSHVLKIRHALSSATFAALSMFGSAQAGLIGHEVTCAINDTNMSCTPSPAIVGAGIEASIDRFGQILFNLDFDDSGLTATFTGGRTAFAIGYAMTFTDNTSPFTSAALVSSTNADITAADVTLSGGVLTVLFGTTLITGDTFRIDLATAPTRVPEPGALALLSIAAIGAGAVRRKQI